MTSGGDDSDIQWSPYSPDPTSLQEFAKTQHGSQYADQISKISDYNWAKGSNGNVHGQLGGVDTDLTQMDQAYTEWLATQRDYNQQRKDYLDLAAQEKGRDATILTGPAAATQGTLLTPFQAKPRF